MTLDAWALKWGIPAAALFDLRMSMMAHVLAASPIPAGDASEARVQQLIRVEAQQHGIVLFRNNVGALQDERGVPVRYGLANESKEQNKVVKSGDLIGIKSLLIEPKHVGRIIGQFVSREVKRESWKWSGDKHETAQRNWVDFVIAKGGDAAICNGPGSFNQE